MTRMTRIALIRSLLKNENIILDKSLILKTIEYFAPCYYVLPLKFVSFVKFVLKKY